MTKNFGHFLKSSSRDTEGGWGVIWYTLPVKYRKIRIIWNDSSWLKTQKLFSYIDILIYKKTQGHFFLFLSIGITNTFHTFLLSYTFTTVSDLYDCA